MTNIIHNIPMAISGVLVAVMILMVLTNIIVEVLKKVTWGKIPTNILAVLVAMVVTLVAFFSVCQIERIEVTWYLIAGAVGLGFLVSFAAMFGFDKLQQTLGQITSISRKKE